MATPQQPNPNAANSVTALTAQPVQPIPRVPLQELLASLSTPELMAVYGREIIESQLAINRFDQDWRLARVFAESGLFADAQQLNQAMTKIQLGRCWSMQASDAMQHIYFVNGKPAVMNEYLAAKMRDAGMDWVCEWHNDKEGACTGVTLWPSRLTTDGWKPIMERQNGELVPASVSFTKADADRVNVKEDGKWIKLSEKSTYKAFPSDMFFWRAIARLRRRYATNILSGVMTSDEAEEIPPPTESAPRIPQAAPAADFTPGRQARRKAGTEDIPGTLPPRQPAIVDKLDVDQIETKQAEQAQNRTEPETKQAEQAQNRTEPETKQAEPSPAKP